jgi:hypothetical protein
MIVCFMHAHMKDVEMSIKFGWEKLEEVMKSHGEVGVLTYQSSFKNPPIIIL